MDETAMFSTVDSRGVHQDLIVRKEDNQFVIHSSTGRLIITPVATNQVRINIEG